MMDIKHIQAIFQFTGVLILVVGLSYGQTVTVEGPPAVELGSNTVYTCTLTDGSSTPTILWRDVSLDPNIIIFIGGSREETNPKHDNFDASVDGTTSTMTITNTQIEDEGDYRCSTGLTVDDVVLTVEVRSTRTLSLESTIVNNIDMYEATCEALEGRPAETITWMLDDGGSPCQDTGVTTPPPGQDLFSIISVCTFPADILDNRKTLKCVISGHQVTALNGEETITLNHNAPVAGIVVVGFQEPDPNLRVSCNIAEADQPTPRIRNYYIYSDGILIHESTTGVNSVVVPEADFNLFTNFTCVAGNYQGNTSSDPTIYVPTKPTTNPSTTVPTPCSCSGLNTGASAGIAVLTALLLASITINIIQFIVWRRQETYKDGRDSQMISSSKHRNAVRETNDNTAYEMITSGEKAYTALKLDPSGSSSSPIIAVENMTFLTRLGSIGRGDFGGVWKGELRLNQDQASIAIRQLPDQACQVTKSTNVLQSIKVLCDLPGQPNIVKCLGYCQQQGSILYEFIFGGTLLTHLQTTGVQSQPTYNNLKPNKVRVDKESLLNFAWQIAKGMQFLSSKNIIHGTLCAHNVLLDERKQCKLADYGIATSLFNKRGKPTRWTSPETMTTGVQTTEGDIWSFGIVLWEIVTLGARPYPNMTFDIVRKEVVNGYMMPRPRHCGQEVYDVMTLCWEKEGRNRISFDHILNNLEKILEKNHNYLSLNDLDEGLYASSLDM